MPSSWTTSIQRLRSSGLTLEEHSPTYISSPSFNLSRVPTLAPSEFESNLFFPNSYSSGHVFHAVDAAKDPFKVLSVIKLKTGKKVYRIGKRPKSKKDHNWVSFARRHNGERNLSQGAWAGFTCFFRPIVIQNREGHWMTPRAQPWLYRSQCIFLRNNACWCSQYICFSNKSRARYVCIVYFFNTEPFCLKARLYFYTACGIQLWGKYTLHWFIIFIILIHITILSFYFLLCLQLEISEESSTPTNV